MMKTCKGCGETKDLSLFYKDHRYKSGYSPRCDPCQRAFDRERGQLYRAKNPNYRHDYYVQNKDRAKQQQAEWYVRNKDMHDARNRQWRFDNPEKMRAYTRKHDQKDREAVSETYVKKMLACRMGVLSRDVPEEIVKATQMLIKLKRELRDGIK